MNTRIRPSRPVADSAVDSRAGARRTTVRRATAAALVALVTNTVLAAAGPPIAHAQPTVPTATFDPTTTAWSSYRDQSGAQFANTFDDRARSGDMVIDLDVDVIAGDYRVGAIFRANPDDRGWESRRDLTGEQFGAKWQANSDRNYRLAGFESYRDGSLQRYAGHWVENVEGLAWASIRDRTSEQFSAKFDEYRRAGMMPIDVDGYTTGGGQRYASVWVANPDGLAWRLHRDMTSDQYAQRFDEYRAEGFRVHTIESYRAGDVQRYAAIWVENVDDRGWYAYRDLDATGFRNRWNRMVDMGFRLDDYEKYDTARGPLYAGVWRQNNDRFDWALRAEVDELAQQHLDEFDVPGISVAITHQGQIVYQRGFGHQDVANGVWMHGNTVNRLASVSKAITGVLAYDVLGDHPEASLDDDVRDHLPWLPDHHDYTLEQTLMNRSCVTHYPDPFDSFWTEHYDSAADAVAEYMDEPLGCAPGSSLYSTAASGVACSVFEELDGAPIDEIIAERLAGPHQLPTLGVDDPSFPEHTKVYTSSDNEEFDPDDQTWKACGGGLRASANDMAEFGMKLLDGTIMTDAEREAMWTPIGSYAAGWDIGSAPNGERIVGKAGRNAGTNAYWRILPDDDMTIMVMSNRKSGGHSASALSKAIGELMLAEL